MPKSNYYLIFCIYLLLKFPLVAQSKSEEIPFELALSKIENTHNVIFNYDNGIVKDIVIPKLPDTLSLASKIEFLQQQTGLIINKVSNTIYTISKAIPICGYVKDDDAIPIPNATINNSFTYALSDENGYFELKHNATEDTVFVRHIGFNTLKRQAKAFLPNMCETITLSENQERINTVLLQTYLVQGIDKKRDWSTYIDYNKFSLLPGLIEPDVLQTAQALPGILSTDETVSNINIRGGSNDQNLVLWDGIKMYQTGHFFGLISSFNPRMTQTASIITNGTDASYTDGVSGTIHMRTSEKVDPKFSGSLGVNFINAELFSNIPTGNNSSLQIASRKSLDDVVRTPTYSSYFDRVTQETEVQSTAANVQNSNQEFSFYDDALRWLYHPTDKDAIRFNYINSHNQLAFNETAIATGNIQTRRSQISQNNLGLGLRYQRQWHSGLSTIFNVYNSEYKLESENADVSNNQLFLQKNKVSETGVKFETILTKNQWQFKHGYSFTETEVINLNDIDSPRLLIRDEEVLREHASYAQGWYTNTENQFSIRFGLRGNYLVKFKTFILEPRLSLRKDLGQHVQIEALGEYKHQSLSQIINFQNDFLGIEKRRWYLSNNSTIPIITSKQASFGILYRAKGWLVDAKAYYKAVNGITTQSQSFTTKYEFVREYGNYNALGCELLLRKRTNKFNNWLSYSYINNIYSFANLDEMDFPSNFNITHATTLGSTYTSGAWKLSAGLNYRIGKPTSIPIDGNEIEDNAINFDEANNTNLQDYFRLDTSAMYTLNLGNVLKSDIGVSIWNLTDQKNTINNYYRISDTNTVNKFSRFSLGFTTNAIVRVYF